MRSSLQDYLKQLKCVPNRGEFSVFSSVVRGNLGNYSKTGEILTQSCAEKYELFLHLTAWNLTYYSIRKVMNNFTGSENP